MGGRKVREGRDLCIRTADSLRGTTEMNTMLQSNYTQVKSNNKSLFKNCIAVYH